MKRILENMAETTPTPQPQKSAPWSAQSAMAGKLIAAVVVTAVIVGGAVYGWQQYARDGDETATETNRPTNKKASGNTSETVTNAGAKANASSGSTNTDVNANASTTGNQSTNTNASQSFSLYFVALEDDGKTGEKIGCGDSLVAVGIPANNSSAPLTSVLEQLLAIDEQFYGKSGLYNALYQSNLAIASVVIESGIATVKLSGSTKLNGVCDSPRVQEQLQRTASQFSEITRVDIFINDIPLAEYLSAD